jgi:16S rRNA (guanine527-N7)-methyltransferase
MMNFDEFINIANASFGNIPKSQASSSGYPEPLKNAAQSEPPIGCHKSAIPAEQASSGSYLVRQAARSELPVGCSSSEEQLNNSASSRVPVGCSLSERQIEQFRVLEGGYREWNAKINVISRKDIDSLYDHHVLHSLAIAEYLRQQRPETYSLIAEGPADVLDLGTGGGFPGIPLAILFPSARFTLCDSVGKKTIVAREIVKLAGLNNVEVVNARAETLTGPYDIIVTRAVATLIDLWPWVKGKYSKSLICLKGGAVEDEISDLIARQHISKHLFNLWPISAWLSDEYFAGKYVVEITRSTP